MRLPVTVYLLIALVGWLASCREQLCLAQQNQKAEAYDVIVYGGTSGGVIAALQAKRMGRSVVLVCPEKHLGGLTSGGLGWTDSGNKAVIGGLAREFYHRVWEHYQRPEAWRWQSRDEYGNQGQGTPAIDGEQRTMWIFEPHVAEMVFDQLVTENQILVYRNEWLDRESGVVKADGRITSIRMLSGLTLSGRMFIDASYEGDLMASAGIEFHVGRESREQYGEEWNGVQTGVLHHGHHFGAVSQPISPYVVPGDSTSGLLPRVSPDPPGEYGAADHRIQAYCFRMCLTNDDRNRIPFPKPEGYDAGQYELLLRVLQAGWREGFQKFDPIPNHKTDTNNHGPFSTDNIGFNYDYPEGSYERRREIIAEHEQYQKGLMYFLANDARIPPDVRNAFAAWGLAADEFLDNGNWPHQIYVREARRMIGEFVMTEHELLKRRPTPQSIGMGSYTMDSHNVQRYVKPDGYVQNEGDIGVSTRGPYAIAFRSILPKQAQCTNLLVPVCLSSSHIAFGSIRMEPVFMILGQSAATTAVLALERNVPVQEVRYEDLRAQLLKDGQVLEYEDETPAGKGSVGLQSLPGVVVDDASATLIGNWGNSTSAGSYVGRVYLHDGAAGDGRSSAHFSSKLPDGKYEVRLAFSQHANRATNVPVVIEHAGGSTRLRVNQRVAPPIDELFLSLGEFEFTGDQPATVTLTNSGTDGHVIADAVQFLPIDAKQAISLPAEESPMDPVVDQPGLPRVLLIGDSISIGYTLPVRHLLAGLANVHRPPSNCSSTGYGLQNLETWLGDQPWDVIHFNFGLHDAKLPPEGIRHAPVDVYEDNLRKLVAAMRRTGAKLVWANTTPVPKAGDLAPNRKFGSVDQYNRVAERVMRELGVSVNNLNSAITPHLSDVGRSNDVHFSAAGYRILANYVAKAIQGELPNAEGGSSVGDANQLQLQESFYLTPYGETPSRWYDAIGKRPSRAWISDGNGLLRQVLKNETGLILFRGGEIRNERPVLLVDGDLNVRFKKTEDEQAAIGAVGRVQDSRNYYMARFRGTDRLELLRVEDGVERPLDFVQPVIQVETRPTGMITLEPYQEGKFWMLSLGMNGDLLTARILDETGREMASVAARDSTWACGQFGLSASRFCASSEFQARGILAEESLAYTETRPQFLLRSAEAVDYRVIKPKWEVERGNARFTLLRDEYDVIIAGAGTGGTSAALQAARLGARVLLLEETDWIGGQMSCAGVTTMDEDGGYGKSPVRERGFYREFNESMVAYYQTLDKDPFMTYYSYPHQIEGGFEPKAARAVLYGFIDDIHRHAGVLDVAVRTKVGQVQLSNNLVQGVTIEFASDHGIRTRDIGCKILIDATEYGDVIPLTGARYRSGNRTSEQLDPEALVQDHTWLAIVREYPEGIPDHLKIKIPPPNYAIQQRRFAGKTSDGPIIWGGPYVGIKGPRHWRSYFAWRGLADSDSPLTGERSVERHTQCGFNGGNDYPVNSATLENPSQRAHDEREGIYKTLGTLYYFQHELGVNWSLAEDEGYATEYNRAKMEALDIRPDLLPLAIHLPQQPYVRESRRILGIRTLRAADLTRYEEAQHFSNAVAMGDYFMDLDHGKTAHQMEADLDAGELPRGGGPFQVPMDVFIPESIDGFLAAEKNISQSRLASGATRLQPVTMLTGQAVGTLSAIAIRKGVQPREVSAKPVQVSLLKSGATLIQRWHSDVPWGTELWQATQLLALYQILDRPGPLTKDSQWLAAGNPWGVDQPLSSDELEQILQRMAALYHLPLPTTAGSSPHPVTWERIRAAARALNEAWIETVEQYPPRDEHSVTAGEAAVMIAGILKTH